MDGGAVPEVLPEDDLSKLLTIAIPTYNRAHHLRPLLDELGRQWAGLEEDADIFVSNNASTDATASVIADFLKAFPQARSTTNAINLGSDGNIAGCFTRADSRYVWILGDDDMPCQGALAQIVQILRASEPDLLYLSARALQTDGRAPMRAPAATRYRVLSGERFAELVNVNLTFISAVLVNKALLRRAGDPSLDAKLLGTSLAQLAWVLEALRVGERFVHVDDPLLLSTPANSGGYSVLRVFCVNHTKAVRACLADRPRLADKIISRTFTGYLPGLIWNVRHSKIGKFVLPPPKEIVEPIMTAQWQYWLFLLPIWITPVWCSWLFLQFSKVVRKLVWLCDAAFAAGAPTRTSAGGAAR